MTTTTLPTNSTDRLLAAADWIENDPASWVQSTWVEGNLDVLDVAGKGVCCTHSCAAGHGVFLTPKAEIEALDVASWETAGAYAFGLADDLAAAIFAGSYRPASMPDVLRVIASIPEGERTVRSFVLALTGAYLTEANLTEADLAGADLTGADLTGADLTRAYLTGAVGSPHRGMPAGWKLNDSGLWVKA